MKTKLVIGIVVVIIIILLFKKDMSDFIIKFIIKHNEGGYVNDPNDKGGETKFGISKASYPHLDIKNITLDQAVEIYKKDYLSKLPTIVNPNLLYQVLDMAINAGPKVALRLYKENKTLEAYKLARIEYYESLSQFPIYGKGWINRVKRTFKA